MRCGVVGVDTEHFDQCLAGLTCGCGCDERAQHPGPERGGDAAGRRLAVRVGDLPYVDAVCPTPSVHFSVWDGRLPNDSPFWR